MKSKFETVESMNIVDRTDCPYGRVLTVAALLRLKCRELEEIGTTLTVFSWDLDRLCLSTKEEPDLEKDMEEYVIRTWDFQLQPDGKVYDVPFTMYRMVYAPDGSGHGEVMCRGSIGIAVQEG